MFCSDLDTLLLVSPAVIHLHPAAQPQREHDARHITRRRCSQRRNVLRCVLLSKCCSRHDTPEVAESYQQPCRSCTSILVKIVVVVPRVEQAAGNVRASSKHEACEVRYTFVRKHVDRCEDDETYKRNAKRKDDVEGTLAEVVAAVCDTEQDHEADCVRRNSPEIRLDNTIAKPLDNLRQEVGRRAEGHRICEGDDTPEYHLPVAPLPEALSHGKVVACGGRKIAERAPFSDCALGLIQEPSRLRRRR